MELTSQRKLAISVLTLGVIALAVDRLILQGESGPATAAASESSPTASGGAPARDRQTDEVSLAEHLRRMAEQFDRTAPTPSAFDVPPGWLAVARVPDQLPTQHPVPAVDPVAPNIRLTSVSTNMAIVNGVTVALGESIVLQADGRDVRAVLTGIDIKERRATFAIDGREVTAQVPTGGRTAR